MQKGGCTQVAPSGEGGSNHQLSAWHLRDSRHGKVPCLGGALQLRWSENGNYFVRTVFPSGFPDGSAGKESTCSAGDTRDMGSIQTDPLEKEIATHSSILAWEIPRTEEPGRLQFIGLQRVRHA